MPEKVAALDDVPSHRDYPPALIAKLLASCVAMLFRS